ncbi:hypothetical protein QBC40DRAFT_310187 [Triangularia verruculosa]|uniref:F-box domain-containing protein n=1 Tax=Triangularia verruculosa TaxID=2587418 RepID=A0AAN6X8D1_9PEZI|nr:hypothetical protein QBC40DRAFT_310187 [Triangularia verruculosa]
MLRLSPEIRQRIYRLLGIAAQENQAWNIFDLHRDHPKKHRLGFHGLLLSCREIYNEAAALLYSNNIFVIDAGFGPLDPLLSLTTTALRSLTHLKIVLNQASCHPKDSEGRSRGTCCFVDEPLDTHQTRCKANHKDLHRFPLRSTDPVALSLLENWDTAAQHLSGIYPGRLTLFLVCDVEQGDIEAGKLALSPLLRLPNLKSCHLRISKRPDPQLQQLSNDFVQNAIGGPFPLPGSGRILSPITTTTAATSHFLDLPRELRLRILGFTDLITPIKEVSWDGQVYRANRSTYSSPHEAGGNGYLLCRRDHHYGCQFNYCWLKSGWSTDFHAGCFCRLKHTAVSSFCQCWAPPTQLFLVCQTLYYEAQHIFFSGNHFIVHDFLDPADPLTFPASPSVDSYPNARLTASRFLREHVPANSLKFIRFLELVFPAYSYYVWPDADHPAIKDWIETIEYVKDKINGPGLTIRLIMAYPPGTPPHGHTTLSGEQGQKVEAGYQNIYAPLALLGRNDHRVGPLHRFYAHLAYPWAYTEDNLVMLGTDDKKYYDLMEFHNVGYKELAEISVLGADRYLEQLSYQTRRIPLQYANHFHQLSDEIVNKSLEAWGKEEREGKEPRISFWHFCHEVLRLCA